MAHAWALLNTSSEWTWPGAPDRVQPAAAIVNVAAYLAGHCGGQTENGLVALVIPNSTTEGAQQSLIDEANRPHFKVKLLWRPVAAAMAWCDRFAGELEHLPHEFDKPMGRLLVLHLGLDEWEATVLEIVPQRHEDGRTHFLPARHRPALAKTSVGVGETLPSFGIHVMRALAVKLLEREGLTPEGDTVWRMLWATPFVRCVLSLVSGRDGSGNWDYAGVPFNRVRVEDVRQEWLDAIKCVSSGGLRTVRFAWEPFAKCPTAQSMLTWRNELDKHATNLLGAIVTGPLADVPIAGDRRLGAKWLQGLPASRVVVEGADLPAGFMAESAARYSLKLQKGLPTYLDSLPRLQVGAYTRGRPAWVPLLAEKDQYVEGGKIWERPEPFRGLSVNAGQDALQIVLDHEEHPTVRQVTADLAQETVNPIPVMLAVAMEPAGGNARIRVLPVKSEAFGRRRDIRVDWRTMVEVVGKRGKPLTAEEWIAEQPRLFPELLQRGHSAEGWRRARECIKRYLQSPTEGRLDEAKGVLRQKYDPSFWHESRQFGNQEETQTAVSSEGAVSINQELLDQFADELCARLTKRGRKDIEGIFRALAFTSSPNIVLQSILDKAIRSLGPNLKDYHLAACGWCLREPRIIADFAEAVLDRFGRGLEGTNNWLKALAENLRYREDATEAITSTLAEDLTKPLLRIFQEQRLARNAQQIFKNAALGITYLLGRRRYDDGYLDPEGVLARAVKDEFKAAIKDYEKGHLVVMGGAIDLQAVLDTMIRYIDRRGPPIFNLAPFVGSQ